MPGAEVPRGGRRSAPGGAGAFGVRAAVRGRRGPAGARGPGYDDPVDPAPIDDLTLAAAAGDREALERLLEQHLPELRAYVDRRAGALLRSQESDADLVQSVCREILEQADAFRHTGEGAFRRWLFTTALRKMSNRRRFLTADRRDVRLRARPAPLDASDHDLDGGPAADRTPSQDATLHEEMSLVEAALGALAPEYQEVIRLARVDALPRAEVAERMGRTEGSVRMLLHRALAAFAIELRAREARPS